MSSLIRHEVRFVLFCVFPVLTFEPSSDSWEGSGGCPAGDVNKLQVVLRGCNPMRPCQLDLQWRQDMRVFRS
jgi:hypothetical protein